MHRLFLLIGCLVPLLTMSNAYAYELTGYVGIDNRFFLQSPSSPEQDMNNGPSLVFEPELYHVS